LSVADKTVFLDEARSLNGLRFHRVIETGMELVDQISQPEMLGPSPRDTATRFSSETTIPLPNSSCPVTILLTSKVMVTSLTRFRSDTAASARSRDFKRVQQCADGVVGAGEVRDLY
jgi:hypothetical protein